MNAFFLLRQQGSFLFLKVRVSINESLRSRGPASAWLLALLDRGFVHFEQMLQKFVVESSRSSDAMCWSPGLDLQATFCARLFPRGIAACSVSKGSRSPNSWSVMKRPRISWLSPCFWVLLHCWTRRQLSLQRVEKMHRNVVGTLLMKIPKIPKVCIVNHRKL